MSERLRGEELRPNERQEEALRYLCEMYEVEYDASHYFVYPENHWMTASWCEGWVGGPQHANPEYGKPQEPAGKPTIYVGVDPEGHVYS